MNYILQCLVLQSNPALSITNAEFELLKRSRITLTAAFALEEIYDVLLANYRELELATLKASVSEMTTWRTGYREHFGVRSEFNRRTLNLLSAARLYLDQFSQWMKETGANPDEPINQAHVAYDSSFEYRFMEALRNHVQHAGMAVHGVGTHANWLPKTDPKHLEFIVAPYASRVSLQADDRFKQGVIEECPESVAILPAARAYVGGISGVHGVVRRLVSPHALDARQAFENAIQKHAAAANEKIPGLTAIAKSGEDIVERIPIFLQWDDVRLILARENPLVTNLSQRFVSNKHRDDV